ncbi:MAG: sigma-70 family RNA polymerase sigma factor [Polyangiaceae bacterium]
MMTAFDASGDLMGTNDWDLFNRWLDGSHAAGLALMDKYQLGWLRYLRRRCGADCEDILQLAMLACVEQRRNFRVGGNFGSYVFGILRNQLSGHRRTLYRQRQLADTLRLQTIDLADTQSDDDNKIEAVERAIVGLPRDLREVLVMRFVIKMKRDRVALTLAVPSGTVASRERRAKAKLFALLAAQSAQPSNEK